MKGSRRVSCRAVPSQTRDNEVPIQGGAPVREEEGRGREDPTEISRSGAREYIHVHSAFDVAARKGV